jgi:urease accessory protein
VVAEADGSGATRLTCLRSEVPIVLRETPDALYLVGGAGGPLGGDDLALEVDVGPGARLTVRTAAASVALPGPGPGPSRLRVSVTVADGGVLHWLPEPVVVAKGCDHRMETTLALQNGAELVWREELILGRHGEEAGSVLTRTTVDVGRAPLLRHELALGPRHPGWAAPSVTAGARAVGSVLAYPGPACPAVLGPTGALLPLAGGGAQVVALADDASALRAALGVWAATPAGTKRPC